MFHNLHYALESQKALPRDASWLLFIGWHIAKLVTDGRLEGVAGDHFAGLLDLIEEVETASRHGAVVRDGWVASVKAFFAGDQGQLREQLSTLILAMRQFISAVDSSITNARRRVVILIDRLDHLTDIFQHVDGRFRQAMEEKIATGALHFCVNFYANDQRARSPVIGLQPVFFVKSNVFTKSRSNFVQDHVIKARTLELESGLTELGRMIVSRLVYDAQSRNDEFLQSPLAVVNAFYEIPNAKSWLRGEGDFDISSLGYEKNCAPFLKVLLSEVPGYDVKDPFRTMVGQLSDASGVTTPRDLIVAMQASIEEQGRLGRDEASEILFGRTAWSFGVAMAAEQKLRLRLCSTMMLKHDLRI